MHERIYMNKKDILTFLIFDAILFPLAQTVRCDVVIIATVILIFLAPIRSCK